MSTLPALIELVALRQDAETQAELRARCQGAAVIDTALAHLTGKIYLDKEQQKTLGLLLARVLAPLAPVVAETAPAETVELAMERLALAGDKEAGKFWLERKEGWAPPATGGVLSGAKVEIHWPLPRSKLES